jgi:V/A-type H+-transporting ATPase subunit E
MTGSEAIIDKIVKDARKIVNSTLEEANASADETLKLANSDAKIYQDRNMAESYIERDEIVRRKITVANLEVKKLLLQAKQKLIDKAFSEAIEAVRNDTKNYKLLITNMLAFAEDGDIVTLSAKDKDLISEEFILKATNKLKVKVSVNKKYGDFDGGIILSSKDNDKNLSLEVELASVRDEFEPQIAKILFGA